MSKQRASQAAPEKLQKFQDDLWDAWNNLVTVDRRDSDYLQAVVKALEAAWEGYRKEIVKDAEKRRELVIECERKLHNLRARQRGAKEPFPDLKKTAEELTRAAKKTTLEIVTAAKFREQEGGFHAVISAAIEEAEATFAAKVDEPAPPPDDAA